MKLGDIAREVNKNETDPLGAGLERYVGLEHLDPEELKISRWGNVKDGVTFTKKFKAGQILFGRRRAYQKKAAVPDFDGICSGDITVIEPIEGKVVPELLPNVIQSDSFFEYAVNESAGSLSPRVKWKHLAEYNIELPDIDTQQKIAELMQAFDLSIEKKNRLQTSMMDAKSVLLKESCKEGEPTSFGDIFELRRELVDITEDSLKYVALEHIEPVTGRVIEFGRSSDAVSIKSKFYPSDILFGKLRPYLRKYWLATEEGVCSTEILVLKCHENCVVGFGFCLIQNDEFINYAVHNSFGTKMPRASWEKICEYTVNLPSVEIQKNLIKRLSIIDDDLAKVRQSVTSTIYLKKECLKKYLWGGEVQ